MCRNVRSDPAQSYVAPNRHRQPVRGLMLDDDEMWFVYTAMAATVESWDPESNDLVFDLQEEALAMLRDLTAEPNRSDRG